MTRLFFCVGASLVLRRETTAGGRHTLDLLRVRQLPYLSRRNYYYEFLHLMPWALLAGLVEGNITSIVVARTFHGSNLLIAIATATPIGALLFSLVWGMLCVGRPKLRLATIFGTATALCVATVCLTPHSAVGGYLFIVQMAAAQVFLSGVVTVRSSLWKHNYPPHARGRIASRLQALRMLVTVGVLIAVSALFDVNPGLYRFVYPIAAASGLAALLILQRVHVRHERAELRADATDGAAGKSFSVASALSPGRVLSEMIRVLRGDPRFAKYLAAQALLGTGVLIVMPVLVIVLDETFSLFWISVILIDVFPKLLIFGSLRRWGRLFDRVGVIQFRVYSGACAAVGVFFGMAATLVILDKTVLSPIVALPMATVLFALRGIMQGFHQGGGSLAWNLGHLHFAKRHDAELYMGVHVSLTGVRGLVAPFIGIALWHLLSWGVWIVALALCTASVLAYQALARSEAKDRRSI